MQLGPFHEGVTEMVSPCDWCQRA